MVFIFIASIDAFWIDSRMKKRVRWIDSRMKKKVRWIVT